jgi:SMC interacting uncharacterized protein involved in chromosome segregation
LESASKRAHRAGEETMKLEEQEITIEDRVKQLIAERKELRRLLGLSDIDSRTYNKRAEDVAREERERCAEICNKLWSNTGSECEVAIRRLEDEP